MIDRNCIASELYTAYCAAVGGVAFNGDKLPAWPEFSKDPAKQKQANAWLAAADRAIAMLAAGTEEAKP